MNNDVIKLIDIYKSTLNSIISSEENWVQFVRYYARFHKYPFDQAVLAFSQNPNAQMIATESIWNRVGRKVSKDAKSITVIKYSDGEQLREILYDISQTTGRPLQRPQWEITDEEKDYMYTYIDEERHYPEKTLEGKVDHLTSDIVLSYYFRDIVSKQMKDMSRVDRGRFLEFVMLSSQLMVKERAGISTKVQPNDFEYLNFLRDNIDFLPSIGHLMGLTTKNVMKSIAELKKSFKKERTVFDDNRNPLHKERQRTIDSQYSNEQQGRGQSSTRQIRKNSTETFTRNQPDQIHGTSDERNFTGEDALIERSDNRENSQSPGSVAAIESSSTNRGYNEKDTTFEPNSEPSRGNGIERIPLQLNNEKIDNKESENENSDSFIMDKNNAESSDEDIEQLEFDLFNDWDSIGQNDEQAEPNSSIKIKNSISQKVIDEVLIRGTGFMNGKQRVVDFYANNPTDKDAAAFLKKEYGIGGGGGPDGLFISYDSKGITLTKGNLLNPEDSMILKWTTVSKRIRELIRQDRYFTIDQHIENDEIEPETKEVIGQPNSIDDTSKTHDTTEQTDNVIDPEIIEEVMPLENYHYNVSDNLYPNGEKTKYKNNVLAIQLLKQLETEKREATREEQVVLARYVGWGGLANVFSSKSEKWSKEYEELKLLLNEQEYREAMESTITAYYTDPIIIEKMYQALSNLGFKKGNILDPAMGTGNFFSNLPENMKESKLYGVELDSITGRISKKLYPNANVSVQGFETTSFKDDQFDVIVGNIPFNNIKVTDSRYDEYNFLIHDYFIAKSLDLVKPGGIVAFITSKGTMDKKNPTVREYMAERSDLLGAIRLPNTAFKAIAGTEVTADILFLQKRETKRNLGVERPSWVDIGYLNGEIEINQYFLNHPEMVIGRMEFDGYYDGSRKYACVLDEGEDMYSLLDSAIQNVEGTFNAREAEPIEEKDDDFLSFSDAPADAKNFTFVVQNENIYYVENRKLVPREFNKKTFERIKGLCEVRDALTDVIKIQTDDYNPSELERLQKVLNDRYDKFVKKNGYINDPVNKKAFQEDDQLPLLLSIEDLNKDKTYRKAPIFYKATIRPQMVKTTADTAKEALEMSMNYKINVDLEYMSRIYNKEPEKIIEELGDLIYLNPEKYTGNILKGWEFRDEYLSGNVYDKLQLARLKAEEYPELFQRNVQALEDVQPPRLLPGDIHFRIGSSWIPKKYYQEFMYETFETAAYNKFGTNPTIQLNYIKYTNTWKVTGKQQEPSSVKVNSVFGTNRKNAYELFEDCLNLQDSTVRDPEPYIDDYGNEKIRYIVNPKETMIARSKQQDIQQAFQNWLFKEPNRCEELLDIYNNTFNTIRTRQYDGSYLSFPEMNEEMELRPHQKDVVARILSTGNALMAHEVGAGKTAAMIAAGMKLKQIGAVKKPMYVVMNHTVEQWATEFMRFYPGANILVTTKEDFKKKNRQKFVSKIAVGEYDAIIIGQSQFEKISMSKERQEESIRRDIQTLSYEIGEAKKIEGKDWSVKQLVVFQKKLEERLKKLQNSDKKDDLLDFEDLGVDALFVDEAHNYKNLYTMTKLTNVAGIGTSSSQRASDMKLKVEYIQELNNGRGVVFATGTPVTNSMSELHVMQRYLQPEALKRAGLEFFDKWAGTFGEVESSLEMTPEGGGYRMRSRFSKFHNLPELMNTFHLVADIQTADMLKLPVPELDGGKAKIIVSPMSDYQKRKMDEFVERSEDIRNGVVDPSVDNMLKLTNEAKLMAIDPRLIDDDAPIDDHSKLSICASNVYDIWEETKDNKLTQIIFCDSGTPKPNKFNAYDEVKRQLIEKGVPKEEIAFIHDAKTDEARDKLFEKVRNGEVRIILGSTSKVGTGTNIQDRLVAAHHIDCPWRPADLIQRDGRILRQGNMNEKVSIYRYVTKGTFDGYLWQIQEQKNRYISQVMTGKNVSRSVDDLDETVLTAAEVKAIATDNPLLLEKMNLDNDVNRLKLVRNRWLNERVTMQRNVEKVLPDRVTQLEKQKQEIQEDLQTVEKFKDSPFEIIIGNRVYYDEKEAGIALSNELKTKPFDKDHTINVGTFKGLEVYIERDVFGEQTIGLKGNKSYSARYGKYEKSNIERLSNIVDLIPVKLESTNRKLEETKQQIIDTEIELKKEFPQEMEYQELLKKQAEMNLKMEFEEKIKQQESKQEIRKDAVTELQR
ncbi:helicase-related protein [Heyndrickxia ginsengihumi]|uniref:helicase-related protein n=1 Tax=Heyndrickxia ginsengihumi TaxID=363870 RepID=UPI0004714C7A|nr:SNF2-related protein [Heyndrickxia ginsengihumi]